GNAITATDANLNPRTAMGLNSNKSKLFLFTVDGRQPGYSEGMTTIEIAQLNEPDRQRAKRKQSR
ncbi:MAG: phosphodiester glycosidase family protein, partial [Chloroflexi bacterium]|nr:phosphodiester glycosidase family protein [Chloroflexota bacterium]